MGPRRDSTWVPSFEYNSDNVGISGDWLTEVRIVALSVDRHLALTAFVPCVFKIDGLTSNGRSINLVNPNKTEPVWPAAAYIDLGTCLSGRVAALSACLLILDISLR